MKRTVEAVITLIIYDTRFCRWLWVLPTISYPETGQLLSLQLDILCDSVKRHLDIPAQVPMRKLFKNSAAICFICLAHCKQTLPICPSR